MVVERRGKGVAAIVPVGDLEFLEALEDRLDLEAARAALKEAEKKGTVSWAQLKKSWDCKCRGGSIGSSSRLPPGGISAASRRTPNDACGRALMRWLRSLGRERRLHSGAERVSIGCGSGNIEFYTRYARRFSSCLSSGSATVAKSTGGRGRSEPGVFWGRRHDPALGRPPQPNLESSPSSRLHDKSTLSFLPAAEVVSRSP